MGARGERPVAANGGEPPESAGTRPHSARGFATWPRSSGRRGGLHPHCLHAHQRVLLRVRQLAPGHSPRHVVPVQRVRHSRPQVQHPVLLHVTAATAAAAAAAAAADATGPAAAAGPTNAVATDAARLPLADEGVERAVLRVEWQPLGGRKRGSEGDTTGGVTAT